MFSRREKELLMELVCEQLTILEFSGIPNHPVITEKINRLRIMQAKLEHVGELVTTTEIRRALNIVCEIDHVSNCRWHVYEVDIHALADNLNALQIHLAI